MTGLERCVALVKNKKKKKKTRSLEPTFDRQILRMYNLTNIHFFSYYFA